MVKYCINDDIESIYRHQMNCLENSDPYNGIRDQFFITYTFFEIAVYGYKKLVHKLICKNGSYYEFSSVR